MGEHASHLANLTAAAEANAKAASDNAAAALLNAQVVVNSERPWIVISIEPHRTVSGNFVFRATNKGRTLADFESGTFDFSFDSYPANVPTPPDYYGTFNAPNQTLIMPDDGFDIQPAGSNPESMIKDAGKTEQMKLGNQFLLFYGRIIYRDVFSREGKDPIRHETRWCYCFDIFRRQFVRTGPDVYNRHS